MVQWRCARASSGDVTRGAKSRSPPNDSGGPRRYPRNCDRPRMEPAMLKTVVAIEGGNALFSADTIEHEGKLWLVPHWLESPSEGYRIPARIVCLDGLRAFQKLEKSFPADYSLGVPVPKAVFDGTHPQPLSLGYIVVERPDIRFPIPRGIH